MITRASRLASASGLDRLPAAKRAVKASLDWLRDPLSRGLPLEVGGRSLRVPARFARPPWTGYEPVATRMAADWLLSRPSAVTLDVGSSVGLYSLLTLALCPEGAAYAFDSDPVALKATLWLCRHAGPDRLRPVFGFVSDRPQHPGAAEEAVAETRALLASPAIPRDPARADYVCINGEEHPGVPVRSLDSLFPGADSTRSWLLKCDVEGAEMLVLRGADNFLRRARPQLLVSVHPGALAGFRLVPADIRRWLEERGYACRVHPAAHEEHWWCEPPPPER